MNKTMFITGILLLSTPLFAECKSGYERAKVIKVLSEGLATGGSARLPEPAEEGSAEKQTSQAKKIRAVILDYRGKKYELRIPASSQMADVALAPGQELCVIEKDSAIHVTTLDGKPLPGLAHPFTRSPSTASTEKKRTR